MSTSTALMRIDELDPPRLIYYTAVQLTHNCDYHAPGENTAKTDSKVYLAETGEVLFDWSQVSFPPPAPSDLSGDSLAAFARVLMDGMAHANDDDPEFSQGDLRWSVMLSDECMCKVMFVASHWAWPDGYEHVHEL
jgi:hypothetical protein